MKNQISIPEIIPPQNLFPIKSEASLSPQFNKVSDFILRDNEIPINCTLQYSQCPDGTIKGVHCKPHTLKNTVRVFKIGNSTKLYYAKSSTAPGVNLKEIHDFNVQTGYIEPDTESENERASESLRTSTLRTISTIRELVACNPWKFFVTITLNPVIWKNRENPNELPFYIKEMARKWRNITLSDKSKPYKDFKYLLIPELHKKGGIHLHGFVNFIPSEYLIPFTKEDIKSSQAFPKYIVRSVMNGKAIYHCSAWEEQFGFNLIEPIRNLDKASNYVIKYVTKALGKTPFKSRYFCSRGLKRAETIGLFQLPDTPEAVHEYEQLVIPHAVVTTSGELLHRANTRPSIFDEETLVGLTTIIDRADLSSDQVLALLSTYYPLVSEIEKKHSDSMIRTQSQVSMFNTNIKEVCALTKSLVNLVHNAAAEEYIYQTLNPEFYELPCDEFDDENPFLSSDEQKGHSNERRKIQS